MLCICYGGVYEVQNLDMHVLNCCSKLTKPPVNINSTSVLTADLGVLDTFIFLFILALLVCAPFQLQLKPRQSLHKTSSCLH